MNRLIDLGSITRALPSTLTLDVGDLLRFSASGGWVAGGTAVELVGAFTRSTVGSDGRVLSPQGPPSVVIFRSCSAGTAEISVVTGHPFRSPSTHRITVIVEP